MDKKYVIDKIKAIQTEGKGAVALYNEISSIVMEAAAADVSLPDGRCAYYLSMEFLTGRGFYNNLMELGLLEGVRVALEQKGVDIALFEEIEDAALGNGGLGRLAACFLDSAAALGLPLYGYGIRYKYGLFKQAIENGFQVELPDDWQAYGDPWSVRREDEKRVIRFADMTVTAVPYDMPVFGKRVNVLRLFEAEGDERARQISAYLYPADDTEEGKLLRLRQEYFFSAAAVGEIIERHVKRFGPSFDSLPEFNAVQLNDTHPVLAIAEFIRILTGEYGVEFKRARVLAGRVFSYTNHTILPEALECWSAELMARILPDIAAVLEGLCACQKEELSSRGCNEDEAAEMAIRGERGYSMANTAVFVCGAVNGVAMLHTDILKAELFKTAYKYYPNKFFNETNGVTQRRWLMLCNKELSSLIDREIGPAWREDMRLVEKLAPRVPAIADDFIAVKEEKKRQLFDYIKRHEGVEIPQGFLVYAQVKRLHEYKRQLMTAFAVLEIYEALKRGDIKNFTPSVFIFGAKSAPAYYRAKGIIKYINEIAAKINSDGQTNGLLRAVFVSNYNVSYAEKIVAGADVSLQVSTAGLEASGTSNMKFMMNGAVTCGTMDGANIEIVERSGEENNYIFGLRVEECAALSAAGYDPVAVLNEDVRARAAVESLVDGTFDDGGTGYFKELYSSLTAGADWHAPDKYFVIKDLGDYVKALLKINADCADRKNFALKQLYNVANSAYFSSDRTVLGYADDIWKIKNR